MKNVFISLITVIATVAILMNIAASPAPADTTVTATPLGYENSSWTEWAFGNSRALEGYPVTFLEGVRDHADSTVDSYVEGVLYDADWRSSTDVEIRDYVFASSLLRTSRAATYSFEKMELIQGLPEGDVLSITYNVTFGSRTQAQMLEQCHSEVEVGAVRDFIPNNGYGQFTVTMYPGALIISQHADMSELILGAWDTGVTVQ